ncbi:hypothetical protein IVA87_33825 [Bradyrhizobium sp. 147]|uniref:hypothetical protein n=1 Tax=Bradyrhizobium sp. 147 TaxID=2782623 RepID=UPI001FF732CE|nr:hypothetical protein [Bradyrhizobium sp. 147]MCK1684234.1 hypothetical protein [Bradyrhizobium sp. 147]
MTVSKHFRTDYAGAGFVETWNGKRVIAIGDSLMMETAAQLADYYGWTINDFADGGYSCADEGPATFAQTPAPGDICVMWLGTNDKNLSLDSSTREADSKSAHLANVLHMAIKDTGKVHAQSMTAGGTWSNLTNVVDARGRTSTTNGSTLTGSVSGTTVALTGYWNQSQAGQFSVTIDGVNKGTFNCYPSSGVVPGKFGYGPFALLFTGLSAGSHTVVVTVVSATGASNGVYVCWIAGLTAGSVVTSDPLVVVGNTHDYTAAGNAAQGTSTARNTRFKTMIADNVMTARSYGLNVVLVDLDAVLGDADLGPDGLHPVHTGYIKVRDAFVSAIG